MADNRKEQERDELHRTIWGIANDLRGSVDGWDFKQYVLGMLFYRYISENFANYINDGEREAGDALRRQLEISGHTERASMPFHKMLLNGQLPQSIGGGIGQSRLCMLLIGTCHIGEVQVSLWDADTMKTCEDAGITLL